MTDLDTQEQVAIVGMAGRFPGAASVDELWVNLRSGVESIRAFTEAELEAAGADRSDPGFVNAGAVMEGIDHFDAAFFGMSRREAELTDPQHRVFLECAWSALEHAGYDPGRYAGRIGVFGGVAANTYFRENVSTHPDLLARTGDYPLLIATEREYAITRVAYKLGLQGPAISVHTACSTSAVAVHLAVQSLLAGESDMALAGGARIRVPATGGYVYQEDGIPSPDGHCRAFDAEARGTMIGSGVAIVVLKRLSEAMRDGDTVYAIIRGSAVNNDGSAKIGYTAPGIDGQVKVIEEALAVAGVSADTIGMVEAHGTGTSLGDPIEVAALTQAYRRDTSRRQYCAIGSLKTNIGHLDAGAGVAGIIKAALSLHHGEIPPSLNYRTPNPQIDFGASPFFVNTELRSWPRADQPRRAAVSAFGLGGTNAHVVLEEGPEPADDSRSPAPVPHALVLSAKTAGALERMAARLADHLDENPELDLGDVAYTLQLGRARLPHRHSIVATNGEEAARLLRQPDASAPTNRVAADKGLGFAFLFPGQGALQPGMSIGLYRGEPAFSAAIDRCAAILKPIIGTDLRSVMFPKPSKHEEARRALEHAGIAQPATFALEYALATLWMSWGIRPSVMVGHSMGEFVAACLGGVFDLEDGLRIIAGRGRMMQELDGGSMLAIMSEAKAVAPLLDADTALAAVNAPARCVASGPAASIEALERRLVADGMDVKRLPISHAAHSAMMDPMVGPLRDLVASTTRGQLKIPMISTATGEWVRDGLVSDPEYWGRHARDTVRFSDAAALLLERPGLIVIEVGPGQSLGSFVRQQPGAPRDRTVLASLRHAEQDVDDQVFILRGLGQVWAVGGDVDWPSLHRTDRRRIALPTYPFERDRHWIERAATTWAAGSPGVTPRRQLARAASETMPTRADEAAAVDADTAAATSRPVQATASRKDRVAGRLASILRDLSGVDISELDPMTSFIDLGFDSLFLTQANSQFRKQFGVRITFRQLFEEAPSIDSLAHFIDVKLPPDAFPPDDEPAAQAGASPQSPDAAATVAPRDWRSPTAPGDYADWVDQLIREQLRVMEKQLELLRSPEVLTPDASQPARASGVVPSAPATRSAAAREAGDADAPRKSHYLATPGSQGASGRSQALTATQQEALDGLIRRYNARTPSSKRLAQAWRPHLADNRAIVGFDQVWKELVYQIVSERSLGSRIWDVDGNEYIDTALGFGTDLFGHSPDFISAALREQVERGWEVGVQNRLLGEVSELVCTITGNERLAFTYSGGEAVEAAIRVARTVTGRDEVAYFTDDIHGRSDIVLGRSVEVQGEFRTVPLVAGVPQRVIDDALVLPYGTPRALEAIRAKADELALVLVEPVRTRNPDLQPIDFLRELRALADEHGFLLVFDEIVTGFRAHPGGVQAMYGIRADVTTFGKVVGGGMPIGLVAGASRYIDVIDGGRWTYGDSSFPEADITASGGTFIKHPLTLAASRAVLQHLQAMGPSLQADLNRRTSEAVAAINDGYAKDGLPIHVEHFSSFFRPTFTAAPRFAGLFQYHLRELGVHTNPPSPSFLSTAHTDEDIEAVVAAYLEAGRAMARGGFLEADEPATAATGRPMQPERSATGTPLPVLPNVARFLVERSSPGANHWNLGVLLQSKEPIDPDSISRVVERLAARHDALRLRFQHGVNGWSSTVAPASEAVPFSSYDLSDLSETEQTAAIERQADELQRSLDLRRGPLFRIATFDLGDRGSRLLVITHHFVMDGLSWRPFWEDFAAIQAALERGEPDAEVQPSTSFQEWAHTLKRRADSDALRNERRAWLDLGWDRVRAIPLDHPDPGDVNTNSSAREIVLEFSTEETRLVFQETPRVPHKVDFLLTALAQTLAGWTGSDTVLFDMMGHGRDEEAFDDVDLFGAIGFFISYTPMVLTIPGEEQAIQLLTSQIQPILRRGLDFDLLRHMASDATVRQVFGALPRAQVLFNHLGRRDELDTVPPGSMFSVAPESIGQTHSPQGLRYYPIAISSQVWKERLQLNFVYSEHLHERATIELLAGQFKERLMAIASRWQGA